MNSTRSGRPVEILLVEDNPGDVRLTREVLKETEVKNTLHVVQDGMEAMLFLRNRGSYTDAPRPDLILLDLNLPRKDGREVLAEVKSDEVLKEIPVVILTISQSVDDIHGSYLLHANCYIQKPLDLDEFIRVVRAIEGFWLTIVRLPGVG